jgi:hypothetical protein
MDEIVTEARSILNHSVARSHKPKAKPTTEAPRHGENQNVLATNARELTRIKSKKEEI